MLETRTESQYYNARGHSKRTDFNQATGVRTVVFDNTSQYFYYKGTNTRVTGSNFPDWRGRLSRGDFCTTYLSGVKHTSRLTYGHASRTVRHVSESPVYGVLVTNERAGVLAFPVTFAQYDSTLLIPSDNQAKMNFVKKVLKAQRQMTALVSLGELGETLRLLKSPAKAFRESVTKYVRTTRRRTRRTHPRHRSRVMRDTWLEASFGWAPLVADIEDARSALAHMGEYQPFKFVRAFSTFESATTTLRSDELNASVAIDYSELKKAQCKTEYRGVVDIEVDPLGFRLARQNFGFDWQEFVPTIWELFPCSFLVDYFSNIGEILTALSLNTSRLRWIAKTVRQERKTSCVGLYLRKWSDVNNVLVQESFRPGPPLEVGEVSVTRDLYTGSLVPDFQAEIPGIGDVYKWLNIAALPRLRLLPLF